MSYNGIERIRETDIQVITDILGEGRFGDIYPGKIQRGTRRIDVAFKTVRNGTDSLERSNFIAQLTYYSKLEPHRNVIQFYGLCSVGDQLYAAFELASHGNLRNFLRRNAMPESESTSPLITLNRTMLINFSHEIAQGMQYLASKKVVHRELMARHILMAEDYTCKIAGLNPPQADEKNLHIRWMAPEVIEEGKFTVKSDVWSFGILMWEVMSLGGQPYPDVATKDLLGFLMRDQRMAAPDNCDPQIHDIMMKCWCGEADLRPSFADLAMQLKLIMESAVEDADIEMAIDTDGIKTE